MGLSTVTPPIFDPLTLAEVKAHLRVDSAEEDGYLAGRLFAARQFAEGHTRRRFATQTLDFTYDYGWPSIEVNGYCAQRIELPVAPVQSVTSVSYIDTNGALQALTLTSQYLVKLDEAVAYVYPAYGVIWPSTQGVPGAVTVRFVAGWTQAAFPDDLRHAMLTLISHWWENREAVAVGTTAAEVPWTAEALLSGYRISRILS